MRTLLLTSLLIVATLASCQDKSNIVVSGQITDELTGKPIPNAEVVVLCWYMSSIDDASFKKQTLTTDQNGNYKTAFAKGHEVNVASKATGFIARRIYIDLKDSKILVNLKLSRAKENRTLISYLSTDHIELDVTDKTPFLRIRFYSVDPSNTLNLGKPETFGFDLSNQKTNSDTSKCDIWFKPVNSEEPPKIIIANKGGGVLPIYADEIKSSFFYEKATAPTTGYLHEYKLKGNEEGFFVLCRDGKTYGKIIFEKSEIDASAPDGKGGIYKEFGKNFSCLYQPNGTTDLSYSTPDIDLENFLVDIRLR
ncbi:MAG: carboxypeptidase regulatory-like domain-containing protein [Flavobacterium sp.]|nr:MAG: carboxypeptidase regulatory-like domain-containing protein [Flavobacterium sp.]